MLIDARIRDLERLLDVTELRARVHNGNLANQNTPGYRAQEVRFEAAYREALARGGREAAAAVAPEVAMAGRTALDNDGNDVSVDAEIGALAQNSVMHQTWLAVLRGRMAQLKTAMSGANG